MLPIPERIIGSRRLFIPLAYVTVTVTLCYYFVLAFVHMPRISIASSSQNIYHQLNHHHHLKGFTSNESPKQSLDNLKRTDNSQEIVIVSGEDESDILLPSVRNSRALKRSTPTVNNFNSSSYKNISWKNPTEDRSSSETHNQNGTRRSKPTKIWSRHQDSPDWIDFKSPFYFLWPNDDDCKQFPVRFAKPKTFTPTALVSYPGSGNSWLRYLVEGTTGIFTGSIFNDIQLYNSGLLGERRSPVDGTTLLQKTHDDTLLNSKKGEIFKKMTELVFKYKGILLIRNPYDALLSYWNFINSNTRDRHKGHALPNQSFHKWKLFVQDASKKWSHLIQDWLENSVDFLLVQYEELKKDPKKELSRIVDYLGQPMDNERLNCVLKYVQGPFQRDHSDDASNAIPSFTDNNSHLDLIVQENIEHVNRLLAIKDIPLRLNYTLHSTLQS